MEFINPEILFINKTIDKPFSNSAKGFIRNQFSNEPAVFDLRETAPRCEAIHHHIVLNKNRRKSR